MTEHSSTSAGYESDPIDINRTAAHPARMYNYLLGGDDNFAADREAAEYVLGALPTGLDGARALIQASAAFMERVVRYLADEAGMRQFLNIGTVTPAMKNVHDVAQKAAPESHVVYVIKDPMVLAQAHRLLKSSPEGGTAFVHSDLRHPQKLMQQVGATLDLTEPVAVMLLGTLSYIADERDPHRIVKELLEPVPSGSYLVINHIASDLRTAEMAETAQRQREMAGVLEMPVVGRDHADVSRFFSGLELVPPGVVELEQWHQEGVEPDRSSALTIPAYAGLGRKH